VLFRSLSDARDYDQLGWSLAQTGHYSTEAGATAYRAPAYPAFLAVIYRIAGHHPGAVRWVQVCLDSLTALLLFRLLSPRDRRAAAIAGWTWALFPAAILFAGDLWSECMFTCCLVGFTTLVARDRRRDDVAAGALLGVLILIKPMMLLFAAMLPLALLARSSRRPATILLSVAIAPVLAWVMRNLIVLGTPALVTSAGVNLWIGNNPQATGGYSAPPGVVAPHAVMTGEVESDRLAGSMAAEWIATHPWHAATLAVRKVALLISSESELVAGTFAPSSAGPRLRDRYRSVPWMTRVLIMAPTLVILVLGVFGVAARGPSLERRILFCLLPSIVLSSLVFFGGSRFRFPAMPLLVLFMGAFLSRLFHSRHALIPRGKGLAAGFAAAAIIAVWLHEAAYLWAAPA